MFLFVLLIFIIIYLFLLMPRYSKKSEWQKLSEHNYAHRGLHNESYPENTLVAYQNAIDHGYGFEFDVQRTKDDVLVIMHDFNLKRACNVDKLIIDLTYDELKDLKVFGSKYHIPLFKEVLELVNGKVPLVIEFKQNDNNTKTCDLAAPFLDNYHGQFCVESFHPLAVKWFKDKRPDWIRGQLSADFTKDDTKSVFLSFMLENLLFSVLNRPDFVAYDVKDIKMFSFRVYRDILKGQTALWTIQDQATFIKYKDNHDLMIFENFII